MYQSHLNEVKGASPCSAPERDVSEIEREGNYLASALCQLNDRLLTLAQRLEPVLVPTPTGDGACTADQCASSALGQSIQGKRHTVERMHSLVDSLIYQLAL